MASRLAGEIAFKEEMKGLCPASSTPEDKGTTASVLQRARTCNGSPPKAGHKVEMSQETIPGVGQDIARVCQILRVWSKGDPQALHSLQNA